MEHITTNYNKFSDCFINYLRSHLQKILFLFAFLIILCDNVFAVPAYPNPICFTQPNGDTLTVRYKGDERIHWYESLDGYTLLKNQAAYLTYARLDPNGNLEASEFVATNINERNFSVNLFLSNTNKKLFYSQEQKNIMLQIWQIEDNAVQKVQSIGGVEEEGPAQATVLGQYKTLCALVQFPDKSFIKSKMEFENLMNQLGYTNGSINGSVRDYFKEVSYNQFDLIVTVCGIYTAPQTEAYYAGSSGNQNCQELAMWIANQIKNESTIDFSGYDSNNDGYVDGFHFIFAGSGQETGTADAIWSHKWQFYPVVSKNGKSISVYSCSPELLSGTTITTIGVICHEMSHAFGASDFYDTDYETNGEYPGTGYWDIMASGSWNGNPSGSKPPHHNMYTKSIVYGWVTPTVLSIPQIITDMPNSAENTIAYRVNTNTNNEYFLLENRQKIGFDASVPGTGLLIYHVHSNVGTSAINATHPQKMYPVCASSTTTTIPTSTASSYGSINTTGCPFPGTSNKTEFTNTSVPPMKSWANANVDKPITQIIHNTTNKTISFVFMGGPDAPPQNDNCSNAISLSCGMQIQGSLNNATKSTVYSDGTANYKDVFYSFTADYIGNYTISLTNFTNNKDLYLYQNCSSTIILESSTSNTTSETINFNCTVTGTYTIRVVDVSSTEGTFNIKITCPNPPNDLCTNAIPLSCDVLTQGNATNSTPTVAINYQILATNNDLFYSFTATTTGNHTFTLSNFIDDKDLMIYANCSSNTHIGNTNAASENNPETTTLSCTAGTTYILRIIDYDATGGTFNIKVTCPPPPPPINDLCTNATVLSCGITEQGSLTSATPTTSITYDNYPNVRDVFYSFTAPYTGSYTIILSDYSIDKDLFVYPNCTNNEALAISETSITPEIITTNFTAGTTYIIRVTDYTGNGGTFNIKVNCPPPTPINDLCENNIPLSCGNQIQGTLNDATPTTDFNYNNSASHSDVFYSFTATYNGNYNITLNNFIGNKDLYLYPNCSNIVASELSASSNTTETITKYISAGTTCIIRVCDVSADGGVFNILVDCPQPPPENDLCAEAIELSCGTLTQGTTTSCTPTSLLFYDDLPNNNDVFYSFTTTYAGTYTFTLSDFSDDKDLILYANCSDTEAITYSASSNDPEIINYNCIANTTYILRVIDFDASGGTFNIKVDCPLPPTPANDICENAFEIPCGTTQGDATGSTPTTSIVYQSLATYCDIFYSFTATTTGSHNITLSDFFDDKDLFLYNDCNAITSIAMSATANTTETITTNLTAGTTYIIRVVDFDASGGTFNLSITCPIPIPINDICSNAIVLSCENQIQGTLTNANETNSPNYGSSAGYNDVFYSFTANYTGNYTITLNDFSNNKYLYLYTNCSSNTSIASGTTNGVTVQTMSYTCSIGTNYIVRVADASNTGGTFNITLNCPPPPPTNDQCSNATILYCGITEQGTLTSANATSSPPNYGSSAGYNDVFYQFTVANAGKHIITLSNFTNNKYLYLYNNCSSNSSIASGNTNGATIQTITINNATVGTNYRIRVADVNNSGGTFNIKLDCPPPNDLCTNAIVLYCGETQQGTLTNANTTNNGGYYSESANYNDVFYSFTTNIAGSYKFNINNFISDKDLHLYPNCNTKARLMGSIQTGNGIPESITYSCTANTTYIIRVTDRTGDGGTFNISVDCPPVQYIVTPSAGSGGSIYPNIAESVTSGSNMIFTATPDICQEIDEWTVNGNIVQIGGSTYTINNIQSNKTINVSFKTITYSVTALAGNGGDINPNGLQSINCNSDIVLTATPDACHEIDEWIIDDNVVQTGGDTYTLTNIISDTTINVTFKTKTYIVTASAGSNGEISPNGLQSVDCDNNVTFTATSDNCHEVDKWIVGGEIAQIGGNTYTINNIISDSTINVTFKTASFTATPSAENGGTIFPDEVQTIDCVNGITFTAYNDNCMEVDEWSVDGIVMQNGGNTYTASNVQSNINVNVSFKEAIYSVTPSVGSGGDIFPSILQTVNCYGNTMFKATPASCKEVDKWTVDGNVVQTGGNTYTINNIQSNKTINVTFKTTIYSVTALAGNGGTISPNNLQSVNCGDDLSFYFTPDAEYQIDMVLIDDIEDPIAKQNANYTFSNITANHTIFVTFTNIININDISTRHIEIYPNPAIDEIVIKSDIQINKVEIYSLTGSLILTENKFSGKINVSSLTQGVYMINIYTNNGVDVKKIVIR